MITADAANIYFLIKPDRIDGITDNPSPEVQIAIDTDHAASVGQPAFVATSTVSNTTNVSSGAAWEVLIRTRFAPSISGANNKPEVYTGPSASSCSTCAAQLVGASNGGQPGSFMEVSVPWTRVPGGKPTPDKFLRFTIATFHANHAAPNNDLLHSDVADTMSDVSTVDELADGDVDSYVDLHFDANGEVFAPLLVSEFLSYPTYGGGGADEVGAGDWVEIYNPNAFAINLQGYKIGDQYGRGGSQAMLNLPNKSLAPGSAVVIVNDKPRFKAGYPTVPDASIIDMATLTRYQTPRGVFWGTKTQLELQRRNVNAALQLSEFKEAVLLLDPSDVVLDVVQYGTPNVTGLDKDNKKINIPLAGMTANSSFERCPPARDTNDAEFDFVTHDPFGAPASNPTPGVPCAPSTGVDLQLTKTASVAKAARNATISYVINWFNNGTAGLSNVVVSDTLPSGISFVAASLPPSTTNGQTRTWNIGTAPSLSGGTIILTGTINPDAPGGVELVNSAGITNDSETQVEAAGTLADNVALAPVTPAVPDLNIVTTGWPDEEAPGQGFCFVINYAFTDVPDGTTATGVSIVDTLPTGLTFNPTGSTTPSNQTGNQLTWDIGTLSAEQTGSITVCVTVDGNATVGNVLTNSITISGTGEDSLSTGNNTEERSLTVATTPNLSVSSQGLPTTVRPNQEFTFDVVYANNGAVDASNVTLVVTLPATGVTLVDKEVPSGAQFSQNGNTLTWNLGVLPTGQSGSIAVKVKVAGTVHDNDGLDFNLAISGTPDDIQSAKDDNTEAATVTVQFLKLYLPLIRK